MNKYILVNSINTYTSKDKGNLQYYTWKKTILDVD